MWRICLLPASQWNEWKDWFHFEATSFCCYLIHRESFPRPLERYVCKRRRGETALDIVLHTHEVINVAWIVYIRSDFAPWFSCSLLQMQIFHLWSPSYHWTIHKKVYNINYIFILNTLYSVQISWIYISKSPSQSVQTGTFFFKNVDFSQC